MISLYADIGRFPSAVWRAIRAAGIEPSAVLERAGLPTATYLDPSTPVSTTQYFAIWKAVEALADDRGFAVRLIKSGIGVEQQPGFIVGLYASSFRDALNRLLRLRLSASERLWTREAGGLWTMGKDWLYATEAEPALSVDLSFTLVLELGRRGSRAPIKPARVQYARARHRCEELDGYYGCPIQFDAPHNAITFASDDLDIPFPGHSPEFVDVMTRSLQLEMQELRAEGTFGDRIKAVMKRAMLNGRPEIANIAGDLGMGVRTLQRRITDDGTTFRALLTEARRELGLQLVSNPDLDVDHITAMLGYQDAASFYRAFKAWEGISPGDWRARHMAASRTPGRQRSSHDSSLRD